MDHLGSPDPYHISFPIWGNGALMHHLSINVSLFLSVETLEICCVDITLGGFEK